MGGARLISAPTVNGKRWDQPAAARRSGNDIWITGMSRTLTVSETNVPDTFRLARLASDTERTAGFLADVIGEQVTDGAPAPNPRRPPCYVNSRLLQLRPRRWPLQLWRRLPPLHGVVGTAGITALAGVLQASMLVGLPITVTAAVMCADWSQHRGVPAGAWSIAATDHRRASSRKAPARTGAFHVCPNGTTRRFWWDFPCKSGPIRCWQETISVSRTWSSANNSSGIEAKLVNDGDGTQTIDRNTSWSICEAVGEHLQQSLRPERSRLPPRLQTLLDELRRRESAKPR